MESAISLKFRLYPTPEQSQAFSDLCQRYADACNFASQYVFDNGMITSAIDLNRGIYLNIRQKFNLKAQLAQSVSRTVTARYKTIRKQMQTNPYACKYEATSKNLDKTKSKKKKFKTVYVSRNLYWLQKTVQFNRPQADLVRNRDYSFVENGTKLSINTLNKRIKVDFSIKGFEHYLDDYKLGTAKLVKSNGKWFLHVGATKTVEDLSDVKHVVGIDRGLRQLMVTYDEDGQTAFYSGQTARRKRDHYSDLRASLKRRNSKSSRRRLRRIGNKENRWMTDYNHQLSKTLCSKYGKDTVFVLEDLRGVQFAADNQSKQRKSDNHTWAFYQLEQFIAYKAIQNRSMILKVDPAYTSQRCPKCERIDKEQRDHKLHEYCCECGYVSNDDRLAAMNIQILGQYILAHPELETLPSYKTLTGLA